MDPITAFQVAAAAAQFTGMAWKIGRRLKSYHDRSIELPPELAMLEERLDLVRGRVKAIETVVRQDKGPSSTTSEDLDVLFRFLARVSEHCQQIDALLSSYLPGDDDTKTDVILKALKSLAKESQIKQLSQTLIENIPFLLLWLMTPRVPPTAEDFNINEQTYIILPEERRVSHLVPRQDIIDDISKILNATGSPGPYVAILEGMGGQGKTQLALEYCRQVKVDKTFSGIFWVDASDAVSVSKTFSAISRKIRPEVPPSDEESDIKETKELLQSRRTPWLIVFDNYDDPGSFALKQYFPFSPLGRIIVTTRSPTVSSLGTTISVPGLDESQGLELLFSSSGLDRDPDTESHGRSIIQRLGFLPLAIAQVGAYLSERKDTMALSEFLEFYDRRTEEVLTSTPEVWEYLKHSVDSASHEDRIKTVFSTWNFSLELLERTINAEDKVLILSLMAFFAVSDLSESLFIAYFKSFTGPSDRPRWLQLLGEGNSWSRDNFGTIVMELKKYSLISTGRRSTEDGMIHISLHPLVRDWIVLRLDDATRRSYYETASQILAQDVLQHRWGVSENLSWAFRLEPDLRNAFISHVSTWDANHRKLALRDTPLLVNPLPYGCPAMTVEGLFAELYQDSGVYEQSIRLSDWLWQHCVLSLPPWPSIRVRAGYQRIESRILQEKKNAAVTTLSIARDVAEYAQQTKDKSLIAWGQHILAMVLLCEPCTTEQNREARTLLHGLLDNPQLSAPQRHTYTAELAHAYHEAPGSDNDRETAHSMLDQTYQESEVQGGKEFRRLHWPFEVWARFVNVVDCSDHPHRGTLAPECEETMALSTGTSHPLYLFAQLSYASFLKDQGSDLEASKILSTCVAGLEKQRNRQHLLQEAFYGLAYSYSELGQLADAIPLLIRSIEIRLGAGDPDWTDLVATAWQLADILRQMERYEEMVPIVDLSLHFVENLASLSPQKVVDVGTVVTANYQAFQAKLEVALKQGSTASQFDEALGHLDKAMEALVIESRRRQGPDTEPAPASSPQDTTWYIFDFLLQKAIALSRKGLHSLAAEAYQRSRVEFETYPDITETDSWYYIELVWVFLDWAVEGPQELVRTADMISWACRQARLRFGDDDAVRDRIRHGISEKRDLLRYLPEDEPFTDGLAQTGRSIRIGPLTIWLRKRQGDKSGKPGKSMFSKGLPFRRSHRRQFSPEGGLKQALSVAAAVGGAIPGRDGLGMALEGVARKS